MSDCRVRQPQLYGWAGMVLSSTRTLPELPRLVRNVATLRVQWTRDRVKRARCEWVHRWTGPDRRVWLTIGRNADGYRFRFQRFADFQWSPATRVLTCHARPGAQMKTLRHLLLDQVLPVLASEGTASGFHASAVMIDGRAVAFVGKTGRGKSTLTASFAAAGHPVVTDDCLLLRAGPNGVEAVPTYPSLRLWADAVKALGRPLGHRTCVAEYSQKIRLTNRPRDPIPFCVNPVPLGCVYLLDKLGASRLARIESLSQREAFIELIRYAFRLDPHPAADLASEMDIVAALTRLVPVRRLRIPWHLQALPSVRHAVLRDVHDTGSRSHPSWREQCPSPADDST